jgi:hypothetical protein
MRITRASADYTRRRSIGWYKKLHFGKARRSSIHRLPSVRSPDVAPSLPSSATILSGLAPIVTTLPPLRMIYPISCMLSPIPLEYRDLASPATLPGYILSPLNLDSRSVPWAWDDLHEIGHTVQQHAHSNRDEQRVDNHLANTRHL